MRIRKRQVPLPLSLLSPVPLSDLKPFTDPCPVLQVVQLQPQSTQPPLPLHHGPSPATPPSIAHDQPQPCATHPHEATSRDPSRSSSDLPQKEGGIVITMEGRKEPLIEGEEGSVDEDNHDRKRRDTMKTHDHDITRCTSTSTTPSKQRRLDAAKSSESSSTPNELLNHPHPAYSASEVRRDDGYRCRGEKSIPLKKRTRGTTATAWSDTSIAEPDDHKMKEEEEEDSDRKKNMMVRSNVILCETNKKGNGLLRPITTTHSAAAGGGGGAHINHQYSVKDGGDYRDTCHQHDHQDAQVVLNRWESGFMQKTSTGAVISITNYTTTGTGAAASRTGEKRSSAASSGGGAYTKGGGFRCSRVNGRGWRCNQPTLAGYSLCQHHLGKGTRRLRRTGGSCSKTISTRVAIRNYCPQVPGKQKQKLKPKKELIIRKNDNKITPTSDHDDDHKEGHDNDTYNSSTTSKAAAMTAIAAVMHEKEERRKKRRKKTKLSGSLAPDASTSSSDDIIQRVKFGLVKSRSLTSLLAETDR